MTELEVKVNDIEKRQYAFEAKIDEYIKSSEKSMADFKAEMKEFKIEMRDRDNQRHAEILALQQKTDAKFESIDKKFDEIGNKIDGISKHVQALTITAMVGIVGIAAAVIGFVWSITVK